MFKCRIDIIDNHGGHATVWHNFKDLGERSMHELTEHAESIVKALGSDWKIYSDTRDGLITIGPKNPQTEDAMRKLGIVVPPTPVMADSWLTIPEAELEYGLPSGSIRRDIHRGKFLDGEKRKVGRDWQVRMDAVNRIYDK